MLTGRGKRRKQTDTKLIKKQSHSVILRKKPYPYPLAPSTLVADTFPPKSDAISSA